MSLKIEKFGYYNEVMTYGNGYGLKGILNGKEIQGSITVSTGGVKGSVSFYIGKKNEKGTNYFGSIYFSNDKAAFFEVKNVYYEFGKVKGQSNGQLRNSIDHYDSKYLIRKARDLLYSYLNSLYQETQIEKRQVKKELHRAIELRKERKESCIKILKDLESEKYYCEDMVDTLQTELNQLKFYQRTYKKTLQNEFKSWTNIYTKVLGRINDRELELIQYQKEERFISDDLILHQTTDPWIKQVWEASL